MKKLILTAGILSLMPLSIGAKQGYIKEKELFSLSLGMTKQEVLSVLGKPRLIHCLQNCNDHTIESYEYSLKGQRTRLERAVVACGTLWTCLLLLPLLLYITEPESTSYFLWFQDEKLVQFGTENINQSL